MRYVGIVSSCETGRAVHRTPPQRQEEQAARLAEEYWMRLRPERRDCTSWSVEIDSNVSDDVRERVAKFLSDELGTGFDHEVLHIYADPEFDGVYAVRFVVEPTADLENGPHPDDIGYDMDFLVVLDKDNPRYGVEEVEYETWPPSQAKSLDPFNL